MYFKQNYPSKISIRTTYQRWWISEQCLRKLPLKPTASAPYVASISQKFEFLTNHIWKKIWSRSSYKELPPPPSHKEEGSDSHDQWKQSCWTWRSQWQWCQWWERWWRQWRWWWNAFETFAPGSPFLLLSIICSLLGCLGRRKNLFLKPHKKINKNPTINQQFVSSHLFWIAVQDCALQGEMPNHTTTWTEWPIDQEWHKIWNHTYNLKHPCYHHPFSNSSFYPLGK